MSGSGDHRRNLAELAAEAALPPDLQPLATVVLDLVAAGRPLAGDWLARAATPAAFWPELRRALA